MSLVNKDNKTSCELADDHHFQNLADMLEIALVYQPQDEDMKTFHQSQLPAPSSLPLFILDSMTMSLQSLVIFISESVQQVQRALSIDDNTAENLLDAHDWDVARITSLFKDDPSAVFEQAHLTPPGSSVQQMNPKSLLSFVSDTLAPLARNVHSMLNSHDAEIASSTSLLKSSSEEIHLDAIRLSESEAHDKSENISNEESTVPELCVICSEAMSRAVRLEDAAMSKLFPHSKLAAPCGHAFCLSCWKQFYSLEVKEGRGEAIRCPGRHFSYFKAFLQCFLP